MRRLIILTVITILFSTANSFGQAVKLQMKSGEEKVVTIMGVGSDQLFVSGGNIKFKEIASITFSKLEDASARAQADLKKSGVIILVDGIERAETAPAPTLVESAKNIDGLEKSIEQFRIQRTNAKTAQLIGMLAIGGSLLLQSIYNNQYEKELEDWTKSPSGSAPKVKYVSPVIPAVGLGVFTIGIAIDLGASKHLERR